jgi:heat shock protein HslJ
MNRSPALLRPSRVLLAAVVLGVVACGQSPGPAAGGGDLRAEVADVTWVLEDGLGPDGEVTPSPDARITLHLEVDGDTFGGVSACNHYGGELHLDGSSVQIDQLHQTDMGCEPDTMTVESRYLSALQAVDSVAMEDGLLHLRGDGTDLRFARLPDPPTSALSGTTWRVESIGHGRGDDAPISQAADPAELTIDDGTLHYASSCVEVDAEWVQQGAEYRLTSSSYQYADEPADCLHDDPEQQQMLSVFDGAFTAELEGDRLTLQATRGEVLLVLRPAD